MSEILSNAPRIGVLRDAAIGYYGKIPGRGDFVQSGLPRAFTEPWDRWMQQMISASRTALGEAWLPAWLEAAVWRFALSSGICGTSAVLGLWMPSVDRVGRHFPLTVAAIVHNADIGILLREGGGFLDAAEHAGRETIGNDLPPDALGSRITAATTAQPTDAGADLFLSAYDGGLWWTMGAPIGSTEAFTSRDLPDENTFVAMLVACSSAPPAFAPAQPQ
jgi:type VI secretion system protein ImpM